MVAAVLLLLVFVDTCATAYLISHVRGMVREYARLREYVLDALDYGDNEPDCE